MVGQLVDWDYQWGQIVARAWTDDDFKQRLFAEPAVVLEEYSLAVPAGTSVAMLEESDMPARADDKLYLVLPSRPDDSDLSDDELCSSGATATARRCGCDWCNHCHHCYCGWCHGCHHPPKPEEE